MLDILARSFMIATRTDGAEEPVNEAPRTQRIQRKAEEQPMAPEVIGRYRADPRYWV